MKEHQRQHQLDFLKALQNRSRSAYKQLYEVGFQSAWKYIEARGGKFEDAKDLFQEALIIFSGKIEQTEFLLQKNKKVEGFLMGIVKICWLRKMEKDSQLAQQKKAWTPEKLINLLPTDTTEFNLKKQLTIALKQLGDDCKKVLLDRYFGRFSLKDIAEEMNYTTAYIKVKRHRCMQKLKDLMNQ